jgi:hypothetical protein
VRIHELKSRPENIEAIKDGRPFDVRKNDRSFEVGDWLHLREYAPSPWPSGEGGGYGDLHVFIPVKSTFKLSTVPMIVEETAAKVLPFVEDPDPEETIKGALHDVLGGYVVLGLDLGARAFVRTDEGARITADRITKGEVKWTP